MNEHATIERISRIPFEFGWYSWDLGEYRPFPREYLTYWLFPYETLPPLPTPDPAFRFLVPDDDMTKPNPALDGRRARLRRTLDTLTDAPARLGVTFPDSFIRFMRSPELQARIRSGTGCWFTLSNQLVPCPGLDGGYLVGFLRDQQDCITWCLCLTLYGEHCVLALPMETVETLPVSRREALYGDLDPDEVEGIEELASGGDAAASSDERDASSMAEAAIGGICICAQSFASFIYRFWIEDEIAWKLGGLDKTPLTNAERRYLEHYERKWHADG